MTFHIETERLILREIRITDVDGMFELDSNPIVHKYLGNTPIKTKEESVKIIEFIIKQYKERGIGRWAAIDKVSGDFIGWSGLKLNMKGEELNGLVNFYDVGYRFIPRFWGKGYATESAMASLKYGFEILNLKTIVGAAEQQNIASNKVLKKIGLNFCMTFFYDDIPCNWYELNIKEYGKEMS
ncbi:GNAT family N-acetyltransferase [Seonamhaeicola sp. MEBiC1930]|uniref:GNAT family N-acetyltransferase n=1 Tax=Seonamhaeicola sp. MEBiC01930 TaxID=2976768 RepID=UPI00324FFBFD